MLSMWLWVCQTAISIQTDWLDISYTDLMIGPWFVGEIITNHWGMVFAYGVYVAGHFLPEGLTFIYAFLQVCAQNDQVLEN